MRRLARWLCNALTALSLLLCLAAAGLWVRSYHKAEKLIFRPYGAGTGFAVMLRDGEWKAVRAFEVETSRGLLRLDVTTEDPGARWQYGARPAYEIPAGRFGFAASPIRNAGRDVDLFDAAFTRPPVAVVPLHCLMVAFGALPALRGLVALRRRQRSDRAGSTFCPGCKYDLTGNVSGVCPECGTTIAST